jgi:CMP-N-acetylneuraminic acid synthetase
MILAVIPARGGSKRLPRKNIAPFGGRPLLAWSVELCKHLQQVAACVVSTEDAEIATAATAAGAKVIDRPTELAGDESSITQVLIHAATVAQSDGLIFDGVMLLQPTNPLRPVDMVDRAITRFMSEPCDSLIAVSARTIKTGGLESGIFVPNYLPDTPSARTAPTYFENGLLYLTRMDVLINQGSIYGQRILALETERPFDEVDIDMPVDMVIGEAILAAVRDRLGYA